MAGRAVSEKILFHLVPMNEIAQEALFDPDNCRFVSTAAVPNGKYDWYHNDGLEIGYHVPQIPGGHVITRLGRNTDIILRKAESKVHVAFEINPETRLVLLSTRSRHPNTVMVRKPPHEGCGYEAKQQAKEKAVIGDCVLVYGQEYELTVSGYKFCLVWRATNKIIDTEYLKKLVWGGYKESKSRLKTVESRDYSEEQARSSGEQLKYHTRLVSARESKIRDVDSLRTLIGRGPFGEVFRSYDLKTGHAFAVKVVDLTKSGGDLNQARVGLHREVKILERLSHDNIIELLATDKWETNKPEVFMPICQGNILKLIQEQPSDRARGLLCDPVLEQMLRALDYLDQNNLCHRDVKPENILYSNARADADQVYLFQLADFGFATHHALATTSRGTGLFMAPEFSGMHGFYGQTPKVDIWSLYASMLYIHPAINFPPPGVTGRSEIVQAIMDARPHFPEALSPMARLDPARRASAAQILATVFRGHGLTTPFRAIPAIPPDDADSSEPATMSPVAQGLDRTPAAPKIVACDHRMLPPKRRGNQGPSALPPMTGLRLNGTSKPYIEREIAVESR